jgi:hypothetical protein
LPVASVRRKLSGSRPGWRLVISPARRFSPLALRYLKAWTAK